MDSKLTTIKQELERRFALTTKHIKWLGTKYIAVYFPHAYDYLEFINHTPLLLDFIRSETNRHQEFLTKLSEQNGMDKEKMAVQLSTFSHFNLTQSYDYLQRKIFAPIEQLSHETDRKKLDPWALALTKSPFQIFFRLPVSLPVTKFWKVVKFKAERSSKHFQDRTKQDLQDTHHRLMNFLAEYELAPDKQTKEPTEAVKQLGLTSDSIWQNIEIIFTGEFSVKIKYKNKELLTDHEKMGFSDKRKPDETHAKGSWELLRLLSINNGTFPLTRLTGTDKAKRKKQKQELAKLLKQYFGLDDDPFHELTKEESEYKIKIHLTPDPEFRDDWRDRNMWESDKKIPRDLLMKV